MEVKYIVQYGELFPQCVYCFLMKRCWQPAYNNFFQGNSNKTILVASYFPACQFQFMRTKKKFIHYNKRTHFWAGGHCSYVPLFIVHRALLAVWLDIHSISEESKDNNTISCVFSLNALVYFSKNNRRMINRECKEKEDTCWTWYETQTNKLCDNLFKPYHPPVPLKLPRKTLITLTPTPIPYDNKEKEREREQNKDKREMRRQMER